MKKDVPVGRLFLLLTRGDARIVKTFSRAISVRDERLIQEIVDELGDLLEVRLEQPVSAVEEFHARIRKVANKGLGACARKDLVVSSHTMRAGTCRAQADADARSRWRVAWRATRCRLPQPAEVHHCRFALVATNSMLQSSAAHRCSRSAVSPVSTSIAECATAPSRAAAPSAARESAALAQSTVNCGLEDAAAANRLTI